MITKKVLDSALLGVEKRPLRTEDIPADVNNLIDSGNDPAELLFLKVASLVHFYEEASKLPKKLNFTPPKFIITESKDTLSPNLQQGYNLIDKSELKIKESLLHIWLDKVIEKNQIANEEILLKILVLGNSLSLKTKNKILKIIGNTGQWLLSLEDTFKYTIIQENQQQIWSEGSIDERIQVLEEILKSDTPKGVTMLEETWPQASIHEKYKFISSLIKTSNPSALNFITDKYNNEFAYKPKEKKKEKDCRNLLSMHLLSEPTSEIHTTTINTLSSYFKVEAQNKLFGLLKAKNKTIFNLPQQEDTQFWNATNIDQTFGLETLKHDLAAFNTINEYWLAELLKAIPAQKLMDSAQVNAEDFIECFLDNPRFKIMVSGKNLNIFQESLVQNLTNFPNDTLRSALLKRIDASRYPQLIKSFSTADFENYINQNNFHFDTQLLSNRNKNEVWTQVFSEQLIQKAFNQIQSQKAGLWNFGETIAIHINLNADGKLQNLHSKMQNTEFYLLWNNYVYAPINETLQLKKLLDTKN